MCAPEGETATAVGMSQYVATLPPHPIGLSDRRTLGVQLGEENEEAPHQEHGVQPYVDSQLGMIPLDEHGRLTSIGSTHHRWGSCKNPCFFVHRKVGCHKGVFCEFCHFSHPRRKQPHPCKLRREYLRELGFSIRRRPTIDQVEAVSFDRGQVRSEAESPAEQMTQQQVGQSDRILHAESTYLELSQDRRRGTDRQPSSSTSELSGVIRVYGLPGEETAHVADDGPSHSTPQVPIYI